MPIFKNYNKLDQQARAERMAYWKTRYPDSIRNCSHAQSMLDGIREDIDYYRSKIMTGTKDRVVERDIAALSDRQSMVLKYLQSTTCQALKSDLQRKQEAEDLQNMKDILIPEQGPKEKVNYTRPILITVISVALVISVLVLVSSKDK